jgi:fructokinase
MGGTKVIIAYGSDPSNLSAPLRLATSDPHTTMKAINDEIAQITSKTRVTSIGIASFGPIGIDPHHKNYGIMQATPKAGWSHFDVVGAIESLSDVPIFIDTDVNAAAFAESFWGAGRGLNNIAYITIGTGIGVGLCIDGKCVHGLLHPEAGHIGVKRHKDDFFEGGCPFHNDCLEGLASGPSIMTRTGQAGETLEDTHPIWDILGFYHAQLYSNLALITSAQRLLVGGGLGLKPLVLRAARRYLLENLNGYIGALETPEAIEDYLLPAQLGDRAGLLGAIALCLPNDIAKAKTMGQSKTP